MLAFFRKIRQQLLVNNKFSKYILYAIGEIILVVIGTLIALSINTWSQNKANRAEEVSYYRNIKRQLNEDKSGLEGNVRYNNLYLEQFRYAISIIENDDRNSVDSLAATALNLMRSSDFHRQSNIYQTLVNSGEIKLLKNQQIIEKLQHLEETYIYVNKLEETHTEAIMNYAVPNIVTTIKVYDMDIKDAESLYSFEFQNLFTLFVSHMVEKNDIYDRALERIDGLIQSIDEELESEEE